MQKVSFVSIIVLFLFACEKEPVLPARKPLGYEYVGLWKTDSVAVNGINAKKNINALIWLQLDSVLFNNSSIVNRYTFTGIYEETELSQYGYTSSEEINSAINFNEIKAANPWDPSTLRLDFYHCTEVYLGGESGSTFECKNYKELPIKNRTQNMLSVETEVNGIKRFYRFIRQ